MRRLPRLAVGVAVASGVLPVTFFFDAAFLVVDFLATTFFLLVGFRVVAFFEVAFFEVVFFEVVFFEVVFFLVVDVFVDVDFLATAFFFKPAFFLGAAFFIFLAVAALDTFLATGSVPLSAQLLLRVLILPTNHKWCYGVSYAISAERQAARTSTG